MNKKEYLIANKKWLEAKACEDAVKSLPKGVYYKVLKSAEDGEIESTSANNNKRANINSVISCHYLGRTIDGKCFDTSYGSYPLGARLRELIEGWKVAIPFMNIGDKWEIYIPSELGYGKISQPGIPANSTLIFEIELLGVY